MVKDEGEISGSCEVISSVRAVHRLSINGCRPPWTAVIAIHCVTSFTNSFGNSCRVSANKCNSVPLSDSLQLSYWTSDTNSLIVAQRPAFSIDTKLRLSTLLLMFANCYSKKLHIGVLELTLEIYENGLI